ncbi:MAG TPA: coenzyme-B sulfoethylthiotransferase subunit alpha [Methanoregulaceae archaeon]|jgi:methyl-coenzyme M reductase alpha subunit|nr:coenzyme-B sulfoethylthiotransferase subunit alpha [Methanolinea sp.]MCC7567491.1 coenzyme-B sulfoethylthiotransferase subunit alpha [Methanoregulaceae archaeon]MDD3090833.1 coenzyme-B sulfoethylthiotransferase subunit alpha [Methanoregulaceae archaeon]MDD5684924.1 coenzyme-B sulfoethylthiotransferase subunit alpha [Methanoregulaceae archaeon]HOP66951.1 coenzyme-B sulfoethylthiotransferase subunit alpha [Methanoregulaceae archaeon]
MAKAKIERTQKLFLQSLKEKFAEDPQSDKTVFAREGLNQSARKREFVEAGRKMSMSRGISMYDPVRCHLGGIPLGQRQLMTYEVSTTGVFVEGDDLHFVNNAAMQQMWDDIRRTVLVNMDLAHQTLQKRLGKEVTPETINEYLHVLNHAMPGAAVVQEHMVETHPGLVDDCYCKVFTGDEEMADDLEPQFVIPIDKLFPAKQAAQLKAAVGKSLWQAVHIPTTVSRTCDGGTTSRWSAMQLGMSFIGAYRMCAGEAAVADLAFAAKHAGVVQMADILPARRARGPNEPGGIKFGNFADMIQGDRKYPHDPARASLEVVGAGTMLFDQIWLGSYMSGGVGFTQYATAAYTDNILDEYTYYGMDYIKDKYKVDWANPNEKDKVKPTQDIVNDIATEVCLNGMEQYEQFPTLMEDHFGGSQRAGVLAAACGLSTSIATGNSNAGLNAWYLCMLLHKEGWSRLGFFGYDLQDQCGSTNSLSVRPDEGAVGELRGPNYPNYAMNVGHQGEYAAIVGGAHYGRGDGWSLSPLIKVAFADPSLKFDFAEPRREFAKGAIREFMPAGERSLIIPAR